MLNERDFQTIWYGGREPSWLLKGLAAIYGVISSMRRNLYASGLLARERLPVPVVVVGNINVGGTGKTPLVIALVQALRERGWNPGVITRGYTGNARGAFVLDAHCSPLVAGEEACMILRRTQAPTAVGRDRVAAGRVLLNAASVDVLIADDGLQHLRLRRDVEICVIDGARRFGNGRLLPAGPLREPVSRLANVDFRVCNGGIAQQGEVVMTLAGETAVSLKDPSQARPLRDFAGRRAHGVAGIGNPGRFFAQLRAAGIDPIEHPFDDHFPFAAKDLDFGDELPVLMTEKDAVKCLAFAQARYWSVPIRAQLPETFLDDLVGRLKQHRQRLAAPSRAD